MVGATGNSAISRRSGILPAGLGYRGVPVPLPGIRKDKPIDYPGILFPDALPALEWLKRHGYRTVLRHLHDPGAGGGDQDALRLWGL